MAYSPEDQDMKKALESLDVKKYYEDSNSTSTSNNALTESFLSRLYTHYYTSADAKVFISGSSNIVNIDKIVGIGYDYSITSAPIYTLGLSEPAFYSRGNSLGQGMLLLPFVDNLYLKSMLQFAFGEAVPMDLQKSTLSELEGGSVDWSKASDSDFRTFATSAITNSVKERIVDIGTISSLFDIMIVLDNTNSYYLSEPKALVLKGCKLVGESMDLSSSQDGLVSTGYKFYFKKIEETNLYG